MNNYTWNYILDLIRAYKDAEKTDDEETMAHICNILPDEIRFYGDKIRIVV